MESRKVGLLGCPFCGRQPKVAGRESGPGDAEGYLCFISCRCGGYAARALQFGKGDDPTQAESIAAEAWNTRAKL